MENRINTSARTLNNDPRIDSPTIKVVYPAVESVPNNTTTTQGKPPVAVSEQPTSPVESVVSKPLFDSRPVELTTYILPKGESITTYQRQTGVNENQTANTTGSGSVWDSLRQNPTTVVVILALIFALGYFVAKPKF